MIAIPSMGNGRNAGQSHDWYFVNASFRDICLHHVASGVSDDVFGRVFLDIGRKQLVQPDPSGPPREVSWWSSKIFSHNKDLFQHFETVVCNVLPMLDTDRTTILRLLMQMALSDDTPASKAVLWSLLSLAVLFWNGDLERAVRLKLSALQALMISSKQGIKAKSGVQHVAAEMLLCAFEIQQTDSEWVGHVCGARGVIEAARDECIVGDSDASAILGWVYYHDVTARFIFRHWRTPAVRLIAADLGFNPSGSPSCAAQNHIVREFFSRRIEKPCFLNYAHPVLRLLAEVFNTTLDPWDTRYHDKEYREHLNDLESGLVSVPVAGPEPDAGIMSPPQPPPPPPLRIANALELFRLAGLVYLERASNNFAGRSSKLDRWTDQAFSILAALETCHHPFPLFIFGCEARDDDRRMLILDLITRTERAPHLRTLHVTGALVQSVWIQHDLEIDGEVDYVRTLNLVLSSRDVVPSFA